MKCWLRRKEKDKNVKEKRGEVGRSQEKKRGKRKKEKGERNGTDEKKQ